MDFQIEFKLGQTNNTVKNMTLQIVPVSVKNVESWLLQYHFEYKILVFS